jgi:hypothetical protein
MKINNHLNRLIADKFQENKNNLRRFKVLLTIQRLDPGAQTTLESKAIREAVAHLKS